jgi:hypothetical protein
MSSTAKASERLDSRLQSELEIARAARPVPPPVCQSLAAIVFTPFTGLSSTMSSRK